MENPSGIFFALDRMTLLNTFYRMPVPVFEPHEGNVLVCPERILRRLRDDAAFRVRHHADEVLIDRVVRTHLGEELREFGDGFVGECARLEARLGLAEDLLTGMSEDVRPSGLERVVSDAAVRNTDGGAGEPTGADDGSSKPAANRAAEAIAPGCFGIVQSDPPIRFHSDFRGELIDTVFGNAQTWTFSFGSWYYRLKRWLYSLPQWKRVYRLSQIDNLSISQELLTGVVGAVENVTVYPTYDCLISDVDAAACILAAYHASVNDPNMPMYSNTLDVIANLSKILNALSDDVGAELQNASGGNAAAYFSYKDPVDMKFYVPMQSGRHYASGTFDGHVIVKILLRRGVLIRIPGHGSASADAVAAERLSGQAREDMLFTWTRRLLAKRLGREVPVFVHEQQYLRSGLTAVTALMLLWRVLNAESVFGPRKGKFMLSDLLGDIVEIAETQEPHFASTSIKNFEYMMDNYVTVWYRRDPNVTISQLFPGLVLLCMADSIRSGWDPKHRGDARVSGGVADAITIQSGKTDPVAEYMFTQSSSHQSDTARLEAHDQLLFHHENGLSRILSVTLPRHRVSAVASSLFNVTDIYETAYFVVFGFLPVVMVV